MERATCGVPVTVAASWNSTVTVMTSPAMKAPFEPIPLPESVRPRTIGPTSSAAFPSTRKRVLSVMACVPRPSIALLLAASAIVPPFRASASAAMLIPFESVSPEATV